MNLGAQPGDTSIADARRAGADLAMAAAAPLSTAAEIEVVINAAQAPGSAQLHVQSFELYLIRAINRVDLGQGPVDVVVFPPEFLFVADVGRPAKAGVAVFWNNGQGYGDPDFPDFTKVKLRSVEGTTSAKLIYPHVAGALILGLVAGADPAAVTRDLQAQGLYDISISGTFGEAKCALFDETATAAALPAAVPALRYAEVNSVIRAGGFNPGWSAHRIA